MSDLTPYNDPDYWVQWVPPQDAPIDEDWALPPPLSDEQAPNQWVVVRLVPRRPMRGKSWEVTP